MLTLILADAELELIPSKIWSHGQVRASAKLRRREAGKMLLDASLHFQAMRSSSLPYSKRRGRPDIVHAFLLIAIESILNQRRQLRTIVHTRNNEIIEIEPETRIPKNYNRFVGLFEQLLIFGQVPVNPAEVELDRPLLKVLRNVSLLDYIQQLCSNETANTRVIVFSTRGRPIKALGEYFQKLRSDWSGGGSSSGGCGGSSSSYELICIVGGFPEGDFITPVHRVATDIIALESGSSLKVWTVTAEILVNYKNVFSDNQLFNHQQI